MRDHEVASKFYEELDKELAATPKAASNKSVTQGILAETVALEGACRLAMDLGYATGHAESYEHLVEHVREQAQELRFAADRAEILNAQRMFMAERRLYAAIARAAELSLMVRYDIMVARALEAARAKGLTWEEE